MFELFSQHFEGGAAESRAMGKEMAVKYFRMAEALYYRILESIIEREKMILGDTDLSVSAFVPYEAEEPSVATK